MQPDFWHIDEMQPGAKRPCDAIALGEENSRASDAKEIC